MKLQHTAMPLSCSTVEKLIHVCKPLMLTLHQDHSNVHFLTAWFPLVFETEMKLNDL